MQVRHEALAALCDKYRTMQRLRCEDAAGLAHDPKPQMRALARRFPGALREIDELPLAEIEARIAALEAALEAHGTAPAWARIQLRYHGWMRVALAIKALAATTLPRKARPTPEALAQLVARFRAQHPPGPEEPPPETLTPEVLGCLLQPPEGRLNPWVFARVGQELGMTPSAVEAALFTHAHPRTCRAGPDHR